MSSRRLEVATPLRDQATARIREAILAGELAPGQRLSVDALAQEYGVSLMPIRDALRQLELEGLVETEARRWTRVVEPDLRCADDVYPMIVALEALAIRTAVAGDQTSLIEHNRVFHDAVRRGDAGACLRADEAFHAAVVRSAGNPTLDATLANLRARVRLLELQFFRLDDGEQSPFEHDAIIAAISAGDRAEAERLISAHWARGERAIRDHLLAGR